MRPTLDDVKRDHCALDEFEVSAEGPPVEFHSNVRWDFTTPWGRPIHHVAPGSRLTRAASFCSRLRLVPIVGFLSLLDLLVRGLRLWWASRSPRSVVLLNMGDRSAFVFGLLRWLWQTPGIAIASHVYLYPWSAWKRWLIRKALRSTSAVAVWSNYQARNAEQLLGTDGPVFLRIPYKANHSQQEREPELPAGDYVFSGGNTERDYRTFFAAVDGLPIRAIVSCTSSEALQGLTIPPNVIIVAAREPHFRRLMAGARIVVLCIKRGLLRGAGEATFLNAMWHGRPVVAADDGSASEYIEDGVSGFVTASGDVAALRRRILQLWYDDALCQRIGNAGRELVESAYTGDRWRKRMIALALLHFPDCCASAQPRRYLDRVPQSNMMA